jgi:HlyD family secretion protein
LKYPHNTQFYNDVNHDSHRSGSMKSILRVLALFIILGGGAAVYWYQFRPREVPEGQLRVSGNIETTEVQIAFKISGRVLTRGQVLLPGGHTRNIDEGDRVKTGQVVATLETTDLQCNVEQREAELHVAQAALAALRAGSRPQEIDAAKAAQEKAARALRDMEAGSRPQEIAVAEAAVTSAAAEMNRLQADYHRATAMFQRKATSAESYDAARAAYEVAVERHHQSIEQLKLAKEGFRKDQIEEARWALAQAKAQYDLVKEGPRKEDIDQGKARVEQAAAALKYSKTQLDYATVRSPLTGVVLSKNIEPGEYVAPGTAVVTVGDMDNVWLRAYVEEADKGLVKFGQRAIVTTDTFTGQKHKEYIGRVSFISDEAEFTPKNVQTQKERVKLVYRIKIDIKNPDWDLKPGMPADAVIETTP